MSEVRQMAIALLIPAAFVAGYVLKVCEGLK